MPVITKSHDTVVVDLQGQAYIRRADGQLHPLKLGDKVMRGDLILTSQDGIVELAQPSPEDLLAMEPPAAGKPAPAATPLDRVIEGLAQADPSVVPAAGGEPGSDGSVGPALRVDRITENVDPASLRTSGVSGSALGSSVQADTAQPEISVGDVQVGEADGFITFTITLSTLATQTVTVSYQVLSDTALANADFTPVSGTLTIVAGTNTAVVRVPVTNDTVFEGNESLLINLSNPSNATIGQGSAVAVIVDNDNAPTVSLITPPTASEGSDLVFGVTLSNASAFSTTLPFSLGGGTASGNDMGTPTFTNGVTYNPATGTLTVPAGVTSFSVTVPTTPDTRTESTETVSLSVGTVTGTGSIVDNDAPPTGSNATVTLLEDGSHAFSTTSFGFTATDGDSLAAVRIDTLPGAGSLTLNGNPVTAGQVIAAASLANLVYTPAANGNGAAYAAFTFSVQDSSGDWDTAPNTITLDVTPVNDAPVANADLASTAINTAINNIAVLANDTDGDGNPLSVTGATLANPALGTVTVNPDGTLNFTPATNVTGPVVVNYTINDGQGGTTTGTLTVNVGNNTPPTGADKTLTLLEDGSLALGPSDFGFADADAGQSLASVRIDTLPGAGTLTLNGTPVVAGQVINAADLANLVFTPAANANGTGYASFTFSVQDSSGAFDASPNTITLNVTPVNDAPTTSNVNLTTAEDTAVSGAVLASDLDGDALSFAMGTLPANGAVVLNADGTFTYTPNANYNGSDSFTVTVSDGKGGTVTSTISIGVTPVADPAVIGGATSGATVEDTTTSASGQLTVTDPDAGEAVFVPQTNVAGAHGTFSVNASGQWSYSLNNADPAVQALGAGQSLPSETFTVTSADGSSTTVTVSITGTNDAPVAADASAAATEGGAVVNGSVSATDTDGNAVLTFSLNNAAPAGLTFNANGTYSFNPADPAYNSLAAGQTQTITVPYTVTDDQGATSIATLTITVTGTNDAAVVTGVATGTVTEDGTVLASGTLIVSDVDSATTVVPGSVAGTYGDFTINAAGQWTYTLRNADANVQALTSADAPVESFTVTTADGTTTTVTVTVNGANEAPTVSVTPASGAEDSAGIPISLSGADVDGTVASFTIGSLPANGTLLFNGNPVTVAGGQVIPATANAAVSLSFVHAHAPVAADASAAANWNGSTSFSFSATDKPGRRRITVPYTVTAPAPPRPRRRSRSARSDVADPAVIGGATSGATVEDTTTTSASGHPGLTISLSPTPTRANGGVRPADQRGRFQRHRQRRRQLHPGTDDSRSTPRASGLTRWPARNNADSPGPGGASPRRGPVPAQ